MYVILNIHVWYLNLYIFSKISHFEQNAIYTKEFAYIFAIYQKLPKTPKVKACVRNK